MKKLIIACIIGLCCYTTANAVVYLNIDGEEVDQNYANANVSAEMYVPDRANGVSVMIYPGGAYAWKSMDYEGRNFAEFFNPIGVTVFVINYALPYGNSTAPLECCEGFMRTIKAKASQWNLDPDRIGVMGSSAGGHLATTHATHFSDDTRPAFQILLYPVVSMKTALTHAESRTNLLGATPSEQSIHDYSNELQVKDNTPIAYIALSDDDTVVPPDNSIMYYKSCIDHGISAEIHTFPSGGHGWGYGQFAYRDVFLSTLRQWMITKVIKAE